MTGILVAEHIEKTQGQLTAARAWQEHRIPPASPIRLCCCSLVVEGGNLGKLRWIDTANALLTTVQTTGSSNRLSLLKWKIAQILKRISLQPIKKMTKPVAHGYDALHPCILSKEI